MPIDADPSLAPSDAHAHPLHGAAVIVSGATGAVGKGLLSRLVAIGALPAVAVRKPWQVETTRALLAGGPGLVAHVGTRDGEAAAGFQKGVTDALGPVRALISTSGRFASAEIGRDPAGEDLDLLEANFLTVHNFVRAVAAGMRRRRAGNIVLCGSASVGHGGSGIALYLASKAALHEYARALAVELAPHGVAVALVTPRTIDTAAVRQSMPAADRTTWQSVDEVVDRLIDAAIARPSTAADPLLRLPVGPAERV
ncbi:MAG: SDR family oxidoreductase [Planctomycetes bacterium]|nr:SDR family oxidoreductase [Planctomycetota bacterium]